MCAAAAATGRGYRVGKVDTASPHAVGHARVAQSPRRVTKHAVARSHKHANRNARKVAVIQQVGRDLRTVLLGMTV